MGRWLATGTVVLAMMTLVITEMSTHPVPRRRLPMSKCYFLECFTDQNCMNAEGVFTVFVFDDGKQISIFANQDDIKEEALSKDKNAVRLSGDKTTIEVTTSERVYYFKPCGHTKYTASEICKA